MSHISSLDEILSIIISFFTRISFILIKMKEIFIIFPYHKKHFGC